MYSTTCNIYEYQDFRKYLKDAVVDLRNQCVGFSFRNFSKLAGLGSPNFLILLSKGERNLTKRTAAKIAKTFGLDSMQCEFFENLVLFNQAKLADEKISYAQEITKIRSQLANYKLQCNEFNYYQKWQNIAIKELVQISPGISAEEMIGRLEPSIDLKEIKESLDILTQLKFIKEESGRYSSCINNILTGDQFTSTSVVQFHKNMLRLSEESLDRFKTSERDITAITTGLSPENFEKVRTKIKELRKEILALSEIDENKENVIQINFQMFPLTKKDSI